MKTLTEIEDEIEKLVNDHYYSEDFELVSSMRAYYDAKPADEKTLIEQVVMKRLCRDGSVVDFLWCSIVPIPSAVPILVERLNRESYSSQLSRTLIIALSRYSSDEGYRAVERFLDSDQEMETLDALAEIDFRRSLPAMARIMKKEHSHRIIVHMLYRQMKKCGMEKLLDDIQQSSATRNPAFPENIRKTLRSKEGAYNPFSESDIQHILTAVGVE
jgi:hypothetical protein